MIHNIKYLTRAYIASNIIILLKSLCHSRHSLPQILEKSSTHSLGKMPCVIVMAAEYINKYIKTHLLEIPNEVKYPE